MSGFLGASAGILYSINLIVQVVILLLLIAGYNYKRGKKYQSHGIIMMTTLFAHLLLIAIVMVPSLIINAGAVLTEPILGLIIALHAISGALAAGLAIVIVVAWRSQPQEKLGCRKRKGLMRPTFILWATSILLGVLFYVVAYVL